MDATDVLVVGAGLAGARCAEALRAAGHDARIVVAGDEPCPPYERPALSKELLVGERSGGSVGLRPPEFWVERGIDLRLEQPVGAVDLGSRTALLAGGRLRWRHLVLASGARSRRLAEVPALRGVHHLRGLADAERLRSELEPGRRLAVLGAGFVGAEVASSARRLGLRVTVVEALEAPFARVLGSRVGRRLGERMRSAGVDLRLGARLAGVHAPHGRVRALVLGDGAKVACDLVLVAVGARPNAELLAGHLPLADDGGVPTDPCGRTVVPGVYACGDVASPWRPELGRHVRLEHWTAAAGGARAVAAAILGDERPDPAPPYFWSDQFGWRLQMVGYPQAGTDLELDDATDGFVARYRDAAGRLRAALAVNRASDLARLRAELATEATPNGRRPE